MLSFFPRDLLDEIWDLIESVSEGFPTYFSMHIHVCGYPLGRTGFKEHFSAKMAWGGRGEGVFQSSLPHLEY